MPARKSKGILKGATFLTALLTLSCYRTETTETIEWLAPNWTPDGKIVFIEEYTLDRTKINPILGSKDFGGGHTTLTLCEINRDGSGLRRLAVFYDEDYPSVPIAGPISTSASQDKIVISWALEGRRIIATLNRDGSGYKEIAQGAYADFSPDGKRIVYQKYEGDQPKGIWIMDLESGEERCIEADTAAEEPVWSSEGERIAYVLKIDPYTEAELWVKDTSGNSSLLILHDGRIGILDWGPPDTNALCFSTSSSGWQIARFYSPDSFVVDSFPIGGKWSPDGGYFLLTYEGCIHIFNRQGQEVGCYGP